MTSSSAEALPPAAGDTAAEAPIIGFEFFDKVSWIEITAAAVLSELHKLMDGTAEKVNYTYGGHWYEAMRETATDHDMRRP